MVHRMETPWDNNMVSINFKEGEISVVILSNCDVYINIEVVSEFVE